jgi:hypothetical protein
MIHISSTVAGGAADFLASVAARLLVNSVSNKVQQGE